MPEHVSDDRAFDDFGVDRVTLRLYLTDIADDEASDAEAVERIEERPIPGLGVFSLRDQRVVLGHAIAEERALMSLGEALGPDADPRYLARTWRRASLTELWRQLEAIEEQAKAIAEKTRALLARRYDPHVDQRPLTWGEGRRLVRETENAWAAARRVAYTVRNMAYPMREWASGSDWPSATGGDEAGV